MNFRGPKKYGIALLVLVIAYITFISIPYSVTRHYEGALYQQGKLVKKKVPVTVTGHVYRGVFQTNEFIGTVSVGGTRYSITTSRQSRLSSLMAQFQNAPPPHYTYTGIATKIVGQSVITTAMCEMSPHFNAVLVLTNHATVQTVTH